MGLKHFTACLLAAAVAGSVPPATAQSGQSQPAVHSHPHAHHPAADARPLVKLPEPMRLHMLANMRDHLLALQQIQQALAEDALDKAAQIAEERLGMTSLERHGAHHMAPYMPEEMRRIGTGMHRAASRFATTAGDAAVTGDMTPVLAALARITAQCVACHQGFRVQ
jgi:hypothetical protein